MSEHLKSSPAKLCYRGEVGTWGFFNFNTDLEDHSLQTRGLSLGVFMYRFKVLFHTTLEIQVSDELTVLTINFLYRIIISC